MNETKKILLIGRSGRGKSTLANVISGTNEFKEGKSSVSQTRNIQSESFKYKFTEQEEATVYSIIDTPGIGDTKLSDEEILDIIGEAVYLARDGVSRVLFVTDGRFDENETKAYKLLEESIFDKEITNHTTIIRTKFEDFEDEKECEQDIAKMKESEELKEIIGSCQGRVIHVNNPSIGSKGASKEEVEINESKRSESKKVLLDHLKEVCQKDDYNPQNLKDLSKKVSERIEKKKKLGEALEKLDKQLKRVEGKIKDEKLSQTIKDLNEEIEKENNAIRRTIFEHVQSKVNSNDLKHISENTEETDIPKKTKWKQKVKLFWNELISKIKPLKKLKEKEENLDKEVNIKIEESKEDTNLSDEISKIITDLTKEEKWINKPKFIESIVEQIREVIDKYHKVKNILLIGNVGSGKSTLANVFSK